jgi:hypothetical protein
VTGTESSTPSYVIWNGTTSTWSGTSSANQAASPGSSLIYFKLTADPNSDQIAMGTATLDGQNYDIQIWAGSGWGTPSDILGVDNKGNPYTLLYNVTPSPSVTTDPNFNVGRNFDLAWEKDSGKLVTVFGTSKSINTCEFTSSSQSFPYGTRFKTWDPTLDKTTGNPIGWSTDVIIPNVGRDLVPRWIQLVPDTSSNDIFLEITGQPVTVYSFSNNSTGSARCIVAETVTHISDPKITHDHSYWRHNGGWVYKEEISTDSSSAIQSRISSFFYTAFGESLMAAFVADGTPPSAITDLTITGATSNSVTLQWTAPGDDGNLGKVAGYTLAWSNGSSTNTTTFLPTQFAGGTETFTLTSGIVPATTYSFSITSTDRAGNVSSLSTNNPSVTTPGIASGSGWMTPGVITDFMVVPGSLANNSVQLTWTAPLITSSYSGTMKPAYDLRWAYFKITDSTSFSNANPVLATDGTGRNGLSPAHSADTREFLNFVGLSSGTTYFALKICDAGSVDMITLRCPTGLAENIYPLNLTPKNYPQDLTPVPLDSTHQVSVNIGGSGGSGPPGDTTPPAPITDLTVVQNSVNYNSVILSWTATGDDGISGTASQYDIRYSELPIVDGTFNNAIPVQNPPVPGPSERHELFTLSGLNPNTVYYFAVKAIDEARNTSSLSTCANCPAHTALYSGYNLVSVPYRLSGINDPTSVFGNDVSKPVTIYQWSGGAYSIPSLITEGIGYFLYAPGNNSVLKASDASGNLVSGAVSETAATVTVPLQAGWNMIGNPYLHPIFLKDTCIQGGTGPSVPFGTAVNNGWVGNSIYSFNGTQYFAERYQDILPPSDPNYKLPADLDPWNGYWLQLLTTDAGYSLIYIDTPGACP